MEWNDRIIDTNNNYNQKNLARMLSNSANFL